MITYFSIEPIQGCANLLSESLWDKKNVQNVPKAPICNWLNYVRKDESSFMKQRKLLVLNPFFKTLSERWERLPLLHRMKEIQLRSFCTMRSKEVWQFSTRLLQLVQSETLSEAPICTWLNYVRKDESSFMKQRKLLVLNPFFKTLSERWERLPLLHRMKEIQLRFPHMQVLGVQQINTICQKEEMAAVHTLLLEQYITFPILVCPETRFEVPQSVEGHLAFMFEGCNLRGTYHKHDFESRSILNGIESTFKEMDHLESVSDVHDNMASLKGAKVEYVREPMVQGEWKDTLLLFPGHVSADEHSGRLFISDTNHHRIIITDSSGNVLDNIGSGPGFEDGVFEDAQLHCPGFTLYDTQTDCLYIADSENHAIRKADLSNRVVEVLKERCTKPSSVWDAFAKWLGLSKMKEELDPSMEQENIHYHDGALLFPWKIFKVGETILGVKTQRFEDIKYVCLKTGRTVSEHAENEVDEDTHARVLSLNQEISKLSCMQTEGKSVASKFKSKGGAVLNGLKFIADTEHHQILKLNECSREISTLRLSNLGTLGMPSWWSFHVDLLSTRRSRNGLNVSEKLHEANIDGVKKFKATPGRCQLVVIATLPNGLVLANSVDENCIWRQGRGSLVELSAFSGNLLADKISIAQQWYDDIDDVDFEEGLNEDSKGAFGLQKLVTQSKSSLRIESLFDGTLGEGEIIVDAALFVNEVNNPPTTGKNSNESSDINSLQHSTSLPDSECSNEINNNTRLEEQIYLKRLHVRVRFEFADDAPEQRQFEVFVGV